MTEDLWKYEERNPLESNSSLKKYVGSPNAVDDDVTRIILMCVKPV